MHTSEMTSRKLLQAKIGDIVARNYATAETFESFGLDFCCGGGKTLEQACQEKGLEADTVIEGVMNRLDDKSPTGGQRYLNWSPDFLIDYIINEHHTYTKALLPEIEEYMERVCMVHGIQHPELKQIHWYVEKLSEELDLHMRFEEHKSFPMIKSFLASRAEKTYGEVEGVRRQVGLMLEDHEETGRILATIRRLSKDYTLPADACSTYKVLYSYLQELEEDIHKHVHLENNILVPKVQEALEKLGCC